MMFYKQSISEDIFTMDKIDLEILNCIQHDARLSAGQIAEKVNLSTTPCWRRIRRLEQENVILSKVGLLNRDKLNLGIDICCHSHHSAQRRLA